MQNILPPPALQGDERTQLTQLYRYLFRLSEQLNMSLGALGGQTTLLQRSSGGGGALSPEGTDPEQFWAEADAQYKSLKSLIIKTANIVRAEMDQIVTNLGSEYVAVSEWGAYKEEVSREIVDTAKFTLENFEYNEEILNIPKMAAIFDSYRIETTGYIKRGIIGFDEENFPIIGIAIGQGLKHKEVTVGGEVYEVFDETQNMATYAADKLSFWIDGTEVAYLSNSELVVTRAIVRDSIQLGEWNIEVNKEDGLTIQKRIGNALDLSGNVTITAGQISAIAKGIDLSANTSIKLTADQVNEVASQINLEGNKSITLIAGLVEQKRRVFVATPTPPYDVGDMWTQGSSGDLLRCAKARAEDDEYYAGDWEKASKYTDDTTANQALAIAQKSEIYTGDNPPELPMDAGKIWIDTGVTPTVIRRWKGTGTSTDRDEDGWDTVSDLEEINEISNKLAAQQAEAQKAIDQLATAITIDTSGAHFYKPGYRDRSEVRIDQDSVDILVGGNVNSSFIAGGLILGNYMLWHPAAAGGLAFNLM